MRYYMHDGPAAFRFELAGELDSSDAARLEQDWRTASSIVGTRTLILDMSFVTAIDEAVRGLFRRWYAAGAEFAASSRRSRELVESITGRPFIQQPPHPPTYQSWVSLNLQPLTAPLIPILALLAFLTPIQARGADAGANMALARFVSRSAANPSAAGGDEMAVDIEASLPQMGKQGEVKVIRRHEPAGTTEYEMVRSAGDSTVRQQVIARYLSLEQQAYARPASFSAITPENYKFRYMASIEGGGNRFYVFAIKPRRRGEALMDGQIWIDATTGALVRQEGHLAKRGSVFVKKIDMVREAGPRVSSPYVRVTRVDIDTRWFGHARLTIRERPAMSVPNLEAWQ
jgi:hypothetical protein